LGHIFHKLIRSPCLAPKFYSGFLNLKKPSPVAVAKVAFLEHFLLKAASPNFGITKF
jgi:hypothetical protein